MEFFVLGDEEVVLGFRFAGIPGRVVEDAAGATRAFEEQVVARPGGLGVLLVTERVVDLLGERLVAWQVAGAYPLVVEIPGAEGRRPGRPSLLDAIRVAVGIHL